MDSGTTPLQSPGFLGALTTVHFAIIALLAAVTIIGIVYGMKLSRARRQGTRELEDAGHLERGDTPVAQPAAVEPTRPTPPVTAPATPAPPVERVATTPPAPPVEPAPEPVLTPSPTPVAVTTPATPATADTDLTRLKGLGPKVAAMLIEQGVPDIATLARLDPVQAQTVAAQLGMFAPRMAKDCWIEQAQFLAAGDVAGFEAKFGKL